MKVVENKVADLRESGISGKVGQAADNAKKLPGIVNKQTEVALDRVEDVINQVASYPVGELLGRESCVTMTCKVALSTKWLSLQIRTLSKHMSCLHLLKHFNVLQCKKCGLRPSPQQTLPGRNTLASMML